MKIAAALHCDINNYNTTVFNFMPPSLQRNCCPSTKPSECQAMHQYVGLYQTYVDQSNALFPCPTWNVFGLENRTTNICEGFHLALKQAVMVKHPITLFRLIESLQSIEASNERVLSQLALGAPPKKKKAKYVAVNKAIKRLADNTFAIALPSLQNVLQYLDAVAF
jgi:hypothetical protein